MSSRRARHALAGFLDRFTSRASDVDGYWLFGFLAQGDDPGVVEIDLLETAPTHATTPVSAAIRIARAGFSEQLPKSRLERATLVSAHLRIARSGSTGRVRVGRGDVVDAKGLRLHASARLASGATVSIERTVLAAPHDPRRELRSTRAPLP